jgi:hypothetical protein
VQPLLSGAITPGKCTLCHAPRRLEKETNVKKSTIHVAALLLTLAFLLAGCATEDQAPQSSSAPAQTTEQSTDRASGDSTTENPSGEDAIAKERDGESRAKAGGASAKAGEGRASAKAGGNEARAGGPPDKEKGPSAGQGAGGKAGRTTIKLGGAPGTGFSGTCSLGDEEVSLEGEAPARFSYDLEGRRLECEVSKTGDGGYLKVTLRSGASRAVQTINEGTVSLTLDGSSVRSVSTS